MILARDAEAVKGNRGTFAVEFGARNAEYGMSWEFGVRTSELLGSREREVAPKPRSGPRRARLQSGLSGHLTYECNA